MENLYNEEENLKSKGYNKSKRIDLPNFVLFNDPFKVGAIYHGVALNDYTIQTWFDKETDSNNYSLKTTIFITGENGEKVTKRIYGTFNERSIIQLKCTEAIDPVTNQAKGRNVDGIFVPYRILKLLDQKNKESQILKLEEAKSYNSVEEMQTDDKIPFRLKNEAIQKEKILPDTTSKHIESFNPTAIQTMKKFDLNIEKILENWDIKHAVREIIANAIDEQLLTKTNDIQIFKANDGTWRIVDYGRGLRYEHFTQKENDEKLLTDGIIGKFGIGLKDALATFERKNVTVQIHSKYGDITLGKSQKSGFDDLTTLHAYISEPSNPNLQGTEFLLSNLSDLDIEQAKQLFLKFNNETVIEETKYGQVLNKTRNQGNIYINGVLVATEDNFLFSYNITLLNAAIKKAINRERTNVGRTAYAATVKNILLECQTREVADILTNDLRQFSSGITHDELKWLDVQQHAASTLNKFQKVVFVTAEEIEKGTDLVEEARKGDFQVVAIPSNLRDKLIEQNKIELEKQVENPEKPVEIIRTFNQFVQERNENFEFKFISNSELNSNEQNIWSKKDNVLSIIGGKPLNVNEIVISETMQKDSFTFRPADGLWQPSEKRVIIKRTVLESEQRFISVLLHELAHAISGATDATRSFETELTRLLGVVGIKALSNQ